MGSSAEVALPSTDGHSTAKTMDQFLLVLEPQYRERVWGGQRLRAADPPLGEAWLVYGPSVILAGAYEGKTVDELVAANATAVLGSRVAHGAEDRFPILIKLIDCADWLSVQVHPNDEEARRMVGAGEFGKTEAWYFLDAQPGARILAGVRPDVDGPQLASAIREGRVWEVAAGMEVRGGDSILIPAGTLHALGPGLLLYEIQQASDTTYRAYDWDRPQSAGRKLHIEESVEVTRAVGPEPVTHPEVPGATGAANAVICPYFNLDLVRVATGGCFAQDTGGRSFQVITVTDGSVELLRDEERVVLTRFETALVAGSTGPYDIRAVEGPATLLLACVPD
jgi:mannose-6-phosphate isomerase